MLLSLGLILYSWITLLESWTFHKVTLPFLGWIFHLDHCFVAAAFHGMNIYSASPDLLNVCNQNCFRDLGRRTYMCSYQGVTAISVLNNPSNEDLPPLGSLFSFQSSKWVQYWESLKHLLHPDLWKWEAGVGHDPHQVAFHRSSG